MSVAPKTILDLNLSDAGSGDDEDYVPRTTSRSSKGKKRRRNNAGSQGSESGSEDSDDSGNNSEGVDDHGSVKRSKSPPGETDEQRKARQKREDEETWKRFLEEGGEGKRATSSVVVEADAEERVEIKRPRRFAGEIIYETVRLPASHPDVKKYGSTSMSQLGLPGDVSNAATAGSDSVNTSPHPLSSTPNTPSAPGEAQVASSEAVAAASAMEHISVPGTGTKPKPKGPPIRKKPRQSLEAMNNAIAAGAKGKKMTTLEKSQMDWKSHTAALDAASAAELEANRREGGGGFLQKQEFLGRVGDRMEAGLDAMARGRRTK